MSAPTLSMVKDAAATGTRGVNADLIISAIRCGKWKGPVERIRTVYRDTLKKTGDSKAAKGAVDVNKKRLAAVLFSGQFSRRASNALVKHSGLIAADLDLLGEMLPDVRTKLLTSPHLWALFRSPTGDGLKAIFRTPADASKHDASFRAIECHVTELTGLQIDQACRDVARLCFVSDDPDTYLNVNAHEITPLAEAAKPKPTLPSGDTTAPDLAMRQRIAAELLGEIRWDSEMYGFCTCPGNHLHTTADAERDCEIYLDGAPTIHCFHDHCRGI
jgi:VirE N-terminal domain